MEWRIEDLVGGVGGAWLVAKQGSRKRIKVVVIMLVRCGGIMEKIIFQKKF